MEPDIEKVQQIVGKFLPLNTKLSESTRIDNSVIQGSVKLHLMYGEIADLGYKIDDFTVIATYGELLHALKGGSNSFDSTKQAKQDNVKLTATANMQGLSSNIDPNMNIGIDIIKIHQLPVVNDYRENSFYT